MWSVLTMAASKASIAHSPVQGFWQLETTRSEVDASLSLIEARGTPPWAAACPPALRHAGRETAGALGLSNLTCLARG